jgi:hypothetical protein
VKYNGKEYRVNGVHCKGSRILISEGKEKLDVKTKDVELVSFGKGLQFLPRLKSWGSLEVVS